MLELTGTVVALIDDPGQARDARAALTSAGFKTELFEGTAGNELLNEDDDEGVFAAMRRLVLAFGDEARILDRLGRAMEEGAAMVSVVVEEDQAPQASEILMSHGGHDMWRFGEWSFNPIGTEDTDSETSQVS